MTTQRPDEMLVLKGFRVEIQASYGTHEVDSAWETCTGGGLNIEVADPTPGVTTPGHLFVDEITLRGPISGPRRWIIDNLARGRSGRFDMTIVEIARDGSDARRFTYLECFLTRYVFPALSASGTGNLYEEVSIKPIRLELA